MLLLKVINNLTGGEIPQTKKEKHMNKTIHQTIEIQMELEQWILSTIKKIGNTPESSGRGEERYNAYIEAYKCMISKRPIAMQHYQVCKNFRQL